MKPKISMITLGVAALERSLAFYRDGLGFEPNNYKDGDDCIMFRLDGTWLALYPRDSLAADCASAGRAHRFSGLHPGA
ncbi:MAG: VOC family protein [Aliidongia sp.]